MTYASYEKEKGQKYLREFKKSFNIVNLWNALYQNRSTLPGMTK